MIGELKSVGYNITDEQQVQVVIRSLPQSWEHMKVNMTHNPNIKTFQDARRHVELEDERLKVARSFGEAYVVESNSGKPPISKRNKNKKFFKKAVLELKKTQTF
ncbi:hypothetical protein ACH5RR_013733 [Cinchona calisaya]|uniref:Uncharacterized protein n=1 Tax=Cinchona calisaya TaxID=153742 RepID=A0ABD3A0V9_9GENT